MINNMTKMPLCIKGGTCQVTSRNRGTCAPCRFRKCVEAGMCRENIKTGRYSYSKRSQDIIELEQTQNSLVTPPSSPEDHQQAKPHSPVATSAPQECTMPQTPETSPQRSPVSPSHFTYEHSLVSALKHAQNKIFEVPAQTPAFVHLTTLGSTADVSSDDVCIRWLNRTFTENYWSLFIKAIPGFRDLSLSDQMQLIKRK